MSKNPPPMPPEQLEMPLNPPASSPKSVCSGAPPSDKLLVNEALNSKLTQLNTALKNIRRLKSENGRRLEGDVADPLRQSCGWLQKIVTAVNDVINVPSTNSRAVEINRGRISDELDSLQAMPFITRIANEDKAARFTELSAKITLAQKAIDGVPRAAAQATPELALSELQAIIRKEQTENEFLERDGDGKLVRIQERLAQALTLVREMPALLTQMQQEAEQKGKRLRDSNPCTMR